MAEKPEKLFTTLALILAVIAVVVSLVFFGWWALKERVMFGDQPFDPVRWMTVDNAGSEACARGEMVRDIQQRLLAPGMPKAQVMVLLGRPSWEDDKQIEYDLGVCMHVVHGLQLYFDDQGMLLHSRIVQH